jgi:hypothetical protein
MCCFSPVAMPAAYPFSLLARLWLAKPLRVLGTRIYARLEGERQFLVYSMTLTARGEVAMILPLPVVAESGDHALSFVNLEGYPELFDDMAELFLPPPVMAMPKGGFARAQSAARPKLVVHSVGAFEASYVPSPSDFDRLDERFRMPGDVWNKIPVYANYGFAVFRLKPAKNQRVHPMAFQFRTRDATRLFFPTLHVHDGRVHDTAKFSHELYFQGAERAADQSHDARSWGPMRATVKVDRSPELFDADGHVRVRRLDGKLKNEDTWIELDEAPARIETEAA